MYSTELKNKYNSIHNCSVEYLYTSVLMFVRDEPFIDVNVIDSLTLHH